MRICVFDYETTGLTPGVNEPISMAAVMLDENLKEVSRFAHRIIMVNRPHEWSDKAKEVNRIPVQEVLFNGEHGAKVLIEFLSWVSKNLPPNEKALLAGHNVQFDIAFLKAMIADYSLWLQQVSPGFHFEKLFDYHVLDTFVMFYFTKVVVQKVTKKARLVNAAEYYGIPHSAHNAEGDVDACAEVLRLMSKELGGVEALPKEVV